MRPEIDEVDRFRDRTDKERKTKNRPTSPPSAPAGRPPGLKRQPSSASSPKAPKPRTPVWVVILVLGLMGACGYLGWLSFQQQSQIETLSADLQDAVGFMSQSKLLMARLEGDLSETGAEMAQSGTAVEKKLAFLDSEMRKLWGVSNDRNKKAIAANEDKANALDSGLKRLQSDVKKYQSQSQKTDDAFEASIIKNRDAIKGVQSQVALASGEMSITRDTLEESIAELSAKLAALENLAKTVENNTATLESVDASRKQVNERLLSLTEKVDVLQKQGTAKPANATP